MESIVIDTEKEARKIAHYAAIKASRAITKEKRKTQFCRVYEIKVDKSHLNRETQEHLNRLYREAKWFYNSILSNIFNADSKLKEVPVKVNCAWYIRPLKCLSSQMKRGIINRTMGNISSLSTKKKKGEKVGALKYTSQIESIPLPQFGITYRIYNSNSKSKYITIQGLKSIGMVHTELTPVETLTSTLMLKYFNSIPYIKASLIHEPGSSSPFMAE